jgi:1-deoxy-D-xylulose-5-phosphate reductoisomerase
VRFNDNSYKASLAVPDMILPITFALTYPKRSMNVLPSLDFQAISKLTFRSAHSWQKRNIDIAYQVVREKKIISFDTANSIAVAKFLRNELQFHEIYNFIVTSLSKTSAECPASIDDIAALIDEYSVGPKLFSNVIGNMR